MADDKVFNTLEEIADELISSNKKVHLIYAFNATGKTRLSMILKDKLNVSENDEESEIKKILYFNAFTEDLFTWENDLENDENRYLKYDKRTYLGNFLENQQQFNQVIITFQKFVGDLIVPIFEDIEEQAVDDFGIPIIDIIGEQHIPRLESNFKSIRFTVDDETIKISRGEERIFVWSIFVTLLDLIIEELGDSEIDSDFQNFKYIYIDDPISSLDDNNIIDSAIFLKDIIAKSGNTDLKFILSSHQPLFYNVLYNEIRFEKRIKKTCFHVMKKVIENNNEVKYILTDVEKDSPFGYHLKVREELRRAVDSGRVEKFHYALLRNLLEKTATFLGYSRWEEVLLGLEVAGDEITPENIELYAQRIDLFTHNRQSDLEFRELQEREKNTLIELFNSFEKKYKFNQEEENENG
ncbi:anticodon nuclease [Streptococcus oralis subsp. oralis]|uniref:Anticodon nuclease n=1 Tax=Streptococcus oralis subsp. oralis TaxID=1891914 RepID=A0A1X1H435_STROR|nr:anticodon nuclease [Streptococcus oralis]ORO53847.1 anticodon nuclease [Streptococcus oralis subsp. oralis]